MCIGNSICKILFINFEKKCRENTDAFTQADFLELLLLNTLSVGVFEHMFIHVKVNNMCKHFPCIKRYLAEVSQRCFYYIFPICPQGERFAKMWKCCALYMKPTPSTLRWPFSDQWCYFIKIKTVKYSLYYFPFYTIYKLWVFICIIFM